MRFGPAGYPSAGKTPEGSLEYTRKLGLDGNGELLFNAYRASVWGDDKVLGMDGGDSHTTM